MSKASRQDRELIVDILSRAFDDNKSVNYVVTQDRQRARRIRRLMAYSFDLCFRFGKVYLSADKKACALVLLPDQKRFTLSILWLDLKLALFGIGPGNLRKVMNRESQIKQARTDQAIYYLWFIGVTPAEQSKGAGTALLEAVLQDSLEMQRPVYLETSVPSNVAWYQRRGFEIYRELNVGYPLFFLRK